VQCGFGRTGTMFAVEQAQVTPDVIVLAKGIASGFPFAAIGALALALRRMQTLGELPTPIPLTPVAAVSAGIVDDKVLLDLCYMEDSRAEVDLNVVMNGAGAFIEVQGTAERGTFTGQQLDQMLALARGGITRLLALQQKALPS